MLVGDSNIDSLGILLRVTSNLILIYSCERLVSTSLEKSKVELHKYLFEYSNLQGP